MTVRKTKPVKLEKESTGGRGRVFIDEGILRGLAQIQCTIVEAAAVLKVTKRTLLRRLEEPKFKDAWEQGQAEGRASLRRLQWRHAKMPNSAGVSMTIHLSKHHLGQTEKAALELTGQNGGPIEVNTSARDRVNAKLDTLAKRQSSRIDGLAVAVGAKRAAGEPVGS